VDRAAIRRPVGTAGRVLATASMMLVAMLVAVPAIATVAPDTDPLDELDILAVRDGDPTQVMFAAPARLQTRTLTAADVQATVDGEVQQVELRQLGAADQELVVVVDTTVGIEELRQQQAAIIELALGLPSGATMRIVDAQGNVSEPLAASGPAISALRLLEPDGDGDLTAAVRRARTSLDQSARARGTLLVVGTGLASRLEPIDGLPFTRVAYVIDVGGAGDGRSLLGPDAGGAVIRIDSGEQLLAAMDQVGEELRGLYVARVPRPAADAQTLTLGFPDSDEVADETVRLGTGTLRPEPVSGDQVPADGGQEAQGGEAGDGGGAQDAPAPAEGAAPAGSRAAGDEGSADPLVPIALGVLVVGGLLALLPVVRYLRENPRREAAEPDAPPIDDAEPVYDDVWASPGWAAWSPDATSDIPHPDDRADAPATDDGTAAPTGAEPPDVEADGADAEHERAGAEQADVSEPRGGDAPPAAAAAAAGLGAVGLGAAAAGHAAGHGQPREDEAPSEAQPRRGRRQRERTTRPIAKLTPETREALARAHLGLRQLALASRSAADSVPDELFRLHEATASVALHGEDIDLREVLLADVGDRAPSPAALMAQRASDALVTGWQHTARRSSAPPPVLEINAVLSGGRPRDRDRRQGPTRPVAPVRALNPLVEIGLEHIVLAGHDSADSDLVARAVTVVDIMRAARLARPVLTLSPELADRAEGYATALRGDLNEADDRDAWLELLCGCVWRAATTCADRVTRLDRLRSRYREHASDTRLLPLVDVLLARPLLDAGLLTERLPISRDDATTLLAAAHDAGWVHPYPDRGSMWIAEHVLALFTPAAVRPRSSQPA
jgi:hypothetical protein